MCRVEEHAGVFLSPTLILALRLTLSLSGLSITLPLLFESLDLLL
jgi:hypothetical protein